MAAALAPAERDALAVALAAGFVTSVADLSPSTDRRWWRVMATGQFDAWLIDWPVATSVQPHDHGGSAASIAVVRGALREVRLDLAGPVLSDLAPGTVHRVAADAVHDIANPGPARATSVHVYSPPLRTMVFYDDAGAALRQDDVDPEPVLWSTDLPVPSP
jgi:predicted metal-dependent enzyme (double-stranded beta helix superfamily)